MTQINTNLDHTITHSTRINNETNKTNYFVFFPHFLSQLCILLNAEVIYRIFAEIIFEETTNLKFASTMVRTLNTILLTTSELFELRMHLKDITNEVIELILFHCDRIK